MKAEYVDHLGSDLSVCNAARVSMSKETDWEWFFDTEQGEQFKRLSDRDKKLLIYLANHRHETPFAHVVITLRMKAPIPIARQGFKHKIGFVENEESRRYIKSEPEIFIPEHFRSAPVGSIKQGSGGVHPRSEFWLERYKAKTQEAVQEYLDMLADGVCPEQARFVLPQGAQVNWIWTGSLLAFSRFYKLRSDPQAQKEIQDLAKMVGDILSPLYPVSWAALTKSN